MFPVIIIAQPLLLFMLKRSAGVKFPFEAEYLLNIIKGHLYEVYQIFCPNIAGFMLFASSNSSVYPHGKRRLYFQFSKKP